MTYYRYEIVNEHVYRIIDALGVACYLVVGQTSAVLLDTGYGFAGIRSFVTTLTDLPIKVLLSHGHVDHAMGIYEFGEAYMNPADTEVFHRHSVPGFREKFLVGRGLSIEGMCFQPAQPVTWHPLQDGDRFDLGGYHVLALNVPGHTLGMMMFLLEEDRIMLFGDACGPNTLLMEDASANVEDYRHALLKIKAQERRYDHILRNHGNFVSDKGLLDRVLALCPQIIEGTDSRTLLPDAYQTMFLSSLIPVPLCYSARPVDMSGRHPVYLDKQGEGNIFYRIDKANHFPGK